MVGKGILGIHRSGQILVTMKGDSTFSKLQEEWWMKAWSPWWKTEGKAPPLLLNTTAVKHHATTKRTLGYWIVSKVSGSYSHTLLKKAGILQFSLECVVSSCQWEIPKKLWTPALVHSKHCTNQASWLQGKSSWDFTTRRALLTQKNQRAEECDWNFLDIKHLFLHQNAQKSTMVSES